ncbi:MAG: sodium:dicarboxylate symporter [Verrucomicrobia bacterium]|nr:sodium:dicarboxylate symporter [Verrucomicrobiota bacterium]
MTPLLDSPGANVRAAPASRPFYYSLYFQVLVAIVLGIAFGWIAPAQAVLLKPLSDGFIKVLRLMLPPIIFSTVAMGIGSAGDLRKNGRAGLKALIYFEAMTTLALIIGLVVVHVFKPGAGLNIDPSTLDSRNVAALAKTAEHLGIVDYLLGIIPTGVTAPFADNNILQVLFLGVLFGIALARIGTNADVLHRGFNQLSAVLFVVVGYLIRLAPIAAFAAMSFTIGKYGITTLASLFSPVGCFYVTSAVFVLVVLGLVCAGLGVNIFRFLAYFREELFVVLGTSASEPVLPALMQRLEAVGCSKTMAGFVLPAGYTFNLDGASIYLTMAFVFLAQATRTPLSLGQELFALAVMLLTSKGAAGVPGGGFVALAATLAALHTVPIAALTLLLGVDSFISTGRALVNVIGNAVATVLVSKWEGEFDSAKAGPIAFVRREK